MVCVCVCVRTEYNGSSDDTALHSGPPTQITTSITSAGNLRNDESGVDQVVWGPAGGRRGGIGRGVYFCRLLVFFFFL
jgi:hypothetical protein